MKLGFKEKDPADTGFQLLEDLSTAYWYSQVLFTALELELFGYIQRGADSLEVLAREACCNRPELDRLLSAMTVLGLVGRFEGRYFNSQAAARFLVPGGKEYMGEFFLYRKYMRPQWEALTHRVGACLSKSAVALSYEERNFRYVRAMDTLARQKAPEIAALVSAQRIKGPILDAGGGAGSLSRTLVNSNNALKALLFDIPEVIKAGHRLYPDVRDWQGITPVAGDFRSHDFDSDFGTIILSNFLHAYGRQEARELLEKAVTLLSPDGLLVIHDYFPDQRGSAPQKGALYDLAMMLNTYNGACQEAGTLMNWCREAGLDVCALKELATDSAVILARREGCLCLEEDSLGRLAQALNLEAFVPIKPADVVTAVWAREKCRTGCVLYNKGLQCPPHGMNHEKTRALLNEYSRAFLVRGTPPGRSFHKNLLALEKQAFLDGFHKAFTLGAGPCPVCESCPEDDICRFPHLARPSMEGSGIDVYTTAANAGIHLKPLWEKSQYVTYIGLLLVE